MLPDHCFSWSMSGMRPFMVSGWTPAWGRRCQEAPGEETRLGNIQTSEPANYDDLATFALAGALAEHQALALHLASGLLLLLACDEGRPTVRRATMLTVEERAILVPLLVAYPRACPFEELHTAGGRRRSSEEVQSVCNRLQPKIQACGIQICTVLEQGSILRPSRSITERPFDLGWYRLP